MQARQKAELDRNYAVALSKAIAKANLINREAKNKPMQRSMTAFVALLESVANNHEALAQKLFSQVCQHQYRIWLAVDCHLLLSGRGDGRVSREAACAQQGPVVSGLEAAAGEEAGRRRARTGPRGLRTGLQGCEPAQHSVWMVADASCVC